MYEEKCIKLTISKQSKSRITGHFLMLKYDTFAHRFLNFNSDSSLGSIWTFMNRRKCTKSTNSFLVIISGVFFSPIRIFCENFIFPLHNLNIVDLEFDLQMNFHIDISSSAFQLLHYYCLSLRISSAPAMKSSMLCTRPCPDYA